jgi:hypothetical protein
VLCAIESTPALRIVAFVDHPSGISHQEVELDFFGTVSSSLGQTTIVILGSLQTCSAAL